jgi:membrane protease YdiL (CAAX protease family)
MLLVIPAWVFVGFFVAQLILMGLVWLLVALNVPLESYNQVVLNTSLSAVMYLIASVIVIGLPWFIKKRSTSRADIGLTRLMSWMDILITPAGLVVYLILSSILILITTRVLPWVDINQVQDVGFRQLNQRYEYILAFSSLVVIAPIAEEILFRGYLYGKLRKFVPIWVAIITTSLLFGFIHGAWNLAIDTFALSVVLCLLRESTGNIWASILLHMTKNGIAFYILFINPTLFTTLGR